MSKGGKLTGEGYALDITDWTLVRELPFAAAIQALLEEGGFGGWFITREGIGTGPSDCEMGIKKAEHDALKRAAVKFGIARELRVRRLSSCVSPVGSI